MSRNPLLKLLLCMSMVSLFFMNENKLLACTASKLAVTNVTFTEVNNYTYTIKNISSANIPLNQVVLQNYVSKDNLIGNDGAAGGSLLYLATGMLAPGQTYTGTYSVSRFSNNPESTYPYLILHVYLDNEQCSVSNDAHYIGLTEVTVPEKVCTKSLIAITNVTFTEADSYTYTIKNISSSDIAINMIKLQNYVSKDNVIGDDGAAGGASIDFDNTDMLAPGGTYTGTDYLSRFDENPVSSYPYAIMHFYIKGEQCSINDDAHYIGLAKVSEPTAIQTKNISNASVLWNTETKSFSVNDWNGNKHIELSYEILSVSGIRVLNGKTYPEQINSLHGLKSGMYILYLSDGQQVYSKKLLF